ncbi:MAG TPA: VWA domain-containing protein [Chloroflexota bacterium]|jgi:Mg-chelatase subunit ChlD
MSLELTSPAWLLLLPALAALLVVARWPWLRAGASGAERRRLAFRCVWLSLLVLALAGLTVTRRLDRQAIVFVLDGSASTAGARDAAEAAVRAGLDQKRADDRAGVVQAAAGARVEEPPSERPLFTRLAAALPTDGSDLAAGLRLAGALLPSGYAGRVVLLSDGRQTVGDAVAAARELAARDVRVDVLPLGGSAQPDLRVEAIELPERARRGESSVLTVRTHATLASGRAAAEATLRVFRDDRLLVERPARLGAGRQEIALALPVGEPGLHRYRVDLSPTDPAADATPQNNSLGAVQRVVGPPQVLVVAAPSRGDPASAVTAGFLPEALRAGGAEVTVAEPSRVPADLAGWARYDAVVLADVSARALPPGAIDMLERYVRDLGRGLAMTGGPDSFGPGGYAETGVERALPVYMDLRGRGRQPRVALMLVIDRSGSMAGPKMEMAKEAAARSVGMLRPDDEAGVLAFDSVPQWVAPLTPISERGRIEAGIGSIFAGGGTEIYPALVSGLGALRDARADVKHLILLTDGRSASGGSYGDLVEQARVARVTISTVAVGDDADTGLLEALARAGRGRYHPVVDPGEVPRVFVEETVMATRTILVDGRFVPTAASGGPLLRGLDRVPPLDGYVGVTPKERAEVVLVAPEGDPILAAWQYGAGRAVAWTPDLGGRWAGGWAGSPAATTLWGNVLSWVLPPGESGDLAVRVEVGAGGGGSSAAGGGGSAAAAIVAEAARGWEEVRPTSAVVIGDPPAPGAGPRPQAEAASARREVELLPAGPGRYRASIGAPSPGAYVVQVEQRVADAVLRGEVGWVAPYSAEYRETGPDPVLLGQIAAAGGGRVLSDPGEAVARPERSALAGWPASPFLLVLAALLWPLEIASRRLSLPRPTLRRPALPTLPGRPGGGDREHTEPARSAPAASTAERLIERKRTFRERIGQR